MSIEHPTDIDAQSIPSAEQLRPGIRVMICGNPAGTTLRSRTGQIVGPDSTWDGYFIVRLDESAIYHHPNGKTEELPEIREGFDNLIILPE